MQRICEKKDETMEMELWDVRKNPQEREKAEDGGNRRGLEEGVLRDTSHQIAAGFCVHSLNGPSAAVVRSRGSDGT